MVKQGTPTIIPAKDLIDFDLWVPPEILGKSVNAEQIDAKNKAVHSTNVNTPVTAQNAEQINAAAYQDGLEKGREEGRLEVLKQQQQALGEINSIVEHCQLQVSEFEQEVCEQLVAMTITIAKQVIRRELSVEPEQIMAVIREAINCLPSSSEKIMLKLHPEDAVLVREIYSLDENEERTWKIFEDPGMQRGGCIINSESSVVNADLDQRIAGIVRQLLGGERSDD
ncbi:MAG: hypothetical protein DRQ47_01855 [Gammaproteobacteria bacterium]|nr:MAG: hypothetical protein DRQ47_01855 [Gammaproteobacteria bacterium]